MIDHLNDLRHSLWKEHQSLTELGVLVAYVDSLKRKLILDVNGDEKHIQDKLRKLVHPSDYEYVEVMPVPLENKLELENGMRYGIGSPIHCAGFTHGGCCGAVGTVGGFVRHSRGAQVAEGFAVITTAHAVVCHTCKDNLQQPHRVFVTDDERALMMISEEHVQAPECDAALVILNEYKCDELRTHIIDVFFETGDSKLLNNKCDSGNIYHGLPVQKYGARTNRTTGTIQNTKFSSIGLGLCDTFTIMGEDSCDFSGPGDSGALVTSIINNDSDEVTVYGMVVAGYRQQGKPKLTIAVSINVIFEEFSKLGHTIRFMSVKEYDELKSVKSDQSRVISSRMKDLHID